MKINYGRQEMLTMEFSSQLLEIPDDAYFMLLSQVLIGCSLLSQELTLNIEEKATSHINMPYRVQ